MYCTSAEKAVALRYNRTWDDDWDSAENPQPFFSASDFEVDGVAGIFIYPDDYDGEEVEDESGTWTWDKINSANIVFLPAAGNREGDSGTGNDRVNLVGSDGYYWTATRGSDSANLLYFDDGRMDVSQLYDYCMANSIRLVTEVTE